MVAAVFRTIFVQPDPAAVAATWDEVRDQLATRFPKIGTLMDAAQGGSVGVHRVPPTALLKIWNTNPLERVPVLPADQFRL
jgi:transposase-like protein